MSFTADDIGSNRDYFAHKLQAEKGRSDVVKAAESGTFNFVLLDTRGREAFTNGHITGAWCAGLEDLDDIVPLLPKDQEIVTYCWGHD